MGEKIERLVALSEQRDTESRLLKLAGKVYVPPHARVGKDGKRQTVDGYWREARKGEKAGSTVSAPGGKGGDKGGGDSNYQTPRQQAKAKQAAEAPKGGDAEYETPRQQARKKAGLDAPEGGRNKVLAEADRRGPKEPSSEKEAGSLADRAKAIKREELEETLSAAVVKPKRSPKKGARDAHEAAERRFEEAKEAEPAITESLRETLGALKADGIDGRLEGLQYRLKAPDSLARKIDAEKHEHNGDLDATADAMSDTVRYTMVVDTRDYATGAKAALLKFADEGYGVRTKNYWNPGDPYQGINVAMVTPEGYPFELQFHTDESLEMKEEIHELYEQFREERDSTRRRTLYDDMVKLASKIPTPDGIEGIPFEKMQPYTDAPPLSTAVTQKG